MDKKTWTESDGKELQEAVDRIFDHTGDRLKGLQFSFTIADPTLPGCPLIGCSTGFGALCGYEMKDIVGRNCRVLVDPVPRDQVDDDVRRWAWEFSIAVGKGQSYQIPADERKPYMPASRPSDDGIFLMQMNARKDGTLFNNMFYLRAMELDDQQYIIGLQTEICEDSDYEVCHEACKLLDENMVEVEKLFSANFWCNFAMRRQEDRDPDDGFILAPLDQEDDQPGTELSGNRWTAEQGAKLQEAVDRVFGAAGGDSLKGLQFSITIADPTLEECPLIGCSTGFGKLCGYAMDEIVGRNCKFLVDPVPKELVNNKVRRLAKEFCIAARDGGEFRLPDEELEPWMPKARAADDGLFCAQRNARKDRSLFANMFYLRRVELDDRPYVLGLQTELPAAALSSQEANGPTDADDVARMEACYQACRLLDSNMANLEKVLTSMFWYTGPMRRQDPREPDDSYDGPTCVLDAPPREFSQEVSASPKQAVVVVEETVASPEKAVVKETVASPKKAVVKENVAASNSSVFKSLLSKFLCCQAPTATVVSDDIEDV